MSVARQSVSGAGYGGNTAAVAFGGNSPPFTAATEEWIGDGIITETVT